MTTPPSHPQVSVEETENGYIVHAGSAVATISKTILGYAVDADSQVLKEEYNLSPGVEKVRKSAHTAVQFSADPTDETRLILRTQRNFLLLSQAVEMVCGFHPKDFPKESDWKLLSAWKNERDVVVEPEHAVASQIGETTTPVGVSSGEVQGEFGTTLQDIVSEVEDEVDSEYQSYSWRVISKKSAEKILDKSAFEYHETGIPKDVCDFFGATNLPAGSRKEICLINNSKRLTGYIIKDITKSERVKLRWDDDVSDIISRYRKKDGDKLSLVFFKMLDLDTYNIIVRKVVGAKKGENNTIPSVVEETRSNTESDVPPRYEGGEQYSSYVLKIHEAVSKLPHYRFDKSTEIDVDNGLLVVFEDGEKYGEYDRIVYVGINKASGRLPGRIQEFISGSKDGVVLRKYIGEALLRKDGDSYARIWAKDSSSPEKLRRIGTFYDPKKEEKTEFRVSSYLKKHMSFSVIEIPNSTRRSLLQDELVSTLQEAYSQSSVSNTWLGRYHSDSRIRSCALWMVGNDRSRSFNEEEVQTFLKEVQKSQSLGRATKSISSTPETVSDVTSPVEQTSADNNLCSVNEEPTLDDVLRMENTDGKERILLKVVKHHLRELNVDGSRVLALAPLFLYPGIPKSKITISFGPAYSHTAVSTSIDNLITENIITTYQYQRIGRAKVTYYKFIDVEKFISDLDIQKEKKLRVVSSTLKTIINSLGEEYHLPEEYYIHRFSEEYGEIREKLIDPIILLGLTKEAAQLLVYLHLFKEVTEDKVHDLLLRQMTPKKEVPFLRKLFSSNWIGTKGEQRKKNGKWVVTQLYHLTQPLEDILLDYALKYGEGLNNSVVELRKITAYLAEHPLTISENITTPLDNDERVDDESAISSHKKSVETHALQVNPIIPYDKVSVEQESLNEKYKQIFAESYPNGITIKNRLQLRKLSREFQAVNSHITTLEKEEAFALVIKIIQEIGVFCGDDVWMPESSISIDDNVLTKIITYISTNLEAFPIVDINIVYLHFRSWLPSSISSSHVFNEILKQKLVKGYYFFENYVSNRESASWKPIIKRILKEYLLSCGGAVHISQIEEEFPHASPYLLREVLADINAGFVGGGRSQNYAHVGIFELTDDVIKDIKNLLLKNMDKDTSSITTERIEQIIHESYPELFLTYIDRNMLQEILEYYLSDVFEFKRGAVTLPGVKRRSATDIVIQHFRRKATFTLQDVYDYIEEHHYSVAIMGVLLPLLQEHNFLRVDAQTFVSAKSVLISNDVYENISVKLSHSLYRGYICSDNIADIFSYPFISGWSMTPYLLESIVRVHGSKMRPPLQVIDYYTGPEKPRGIIVKMNGKFSTHDDVLHDLLLKRHKEMPFDSVEEAIQFLKSEKYMERRTNSINEICKTILNTK